MRKSLSGHGGTAAGWKQVAIEKIGFIFFKAERPAVMLLKVVAAQNVPMVPHGLAVIAQVEETLQPLCQPPQKYSLPVGKKRGKLDRILLLNGNGVDGHRLAEPGRLGRFAEKKIMALAIDPLQRQTGAHGDEPAPAELAKFLGEIGHTTAVCFAVPGEREFPR